MAHCHQSGRGSHGQVELIGQRMQVSEAIEILKKCDPETEIDTSKFEDLVRQNGITFREVEVLRMIAKAKSTKEIADTLCISSFTVRNHVQRILEKTGTHSKLEAVLEALRTGLLRSDEVGREVA